MSSRKIQPTDYALLFFTIRPKVLPASLSPVVLGSVMVPPDSFNFMLALYACACAVFFQIAVNLANDYFDTRSGVDTDLRIGPVRLTQNHLIPAHTIVTWTSVFVTLASLCGVILAFYSSWLLLLPGILCILATIAYSGGPFPLASHGLGEITVLLFFGWAAVIGSYYVHTLSINWQLFCLANALGLLQAAIMLVNNIRDIYTDQNAGKNTLAVYLGDFRSRALYSAILIIACIFHATAFWFASDNPSLIMVALPLILCSPYGIYCNHRLWHAHGAELNKVLVSTTLLGLQYAFVTSVCYWLLLR